MKKSAVLVLSSFFIVAILGVTTYSNITVVQASTCSQISSDLAVGLTDTIGDRSITELQKYLQSLGFLKSAPTGHFGPATLAAVKSFQIKNNISSTGYVGPMTRAVINKDICASTLATPAVIATPIVVAPAQTSTPTTQASTPASAPIVSASTFDVTSPSVGQVLPINSSLIIRWNKLPPNVFNIVLEQPGGVGSGFIAQSVSPTAGYQYLWKVGSVFSSQINSNTKVDVGTYRVRLQSTYSGATSSDQVSGWFTIVAPQFVATTVMPASAPADNSTSVVLLGSGFTYYTHLYFDTNDYSTRVTSSYISPDGSVLVFTVPTTMSVGRHTLFVTNGSNISSSSLPFIVSAVQ